MTPVIFYPQIRKRQVISICNSTLCRRMVFDFEHEREQHEVLIKKTERVTSHLWIFWEDVVYQSLVPRPECPATATNP